MMTFVQPKQMQCSACGTTGVSPRMVNIEDRVQIIKEARWVCPRCGNYFHRGIVSCQAKDPQAQ